MPDYDNPTILSEVRGMCPAHPGIEGKTDMIYAEITELRKDLKPIPALVAAMNERISSLERSRQGAWEIFWKVTAPVLTAVLVSLFGAFMAVRAQHEGQQVISMVSAQQGQSISK